MKKIKAFVVKNKIRLIILVSLFLTLGIFEILRNIASFSEFWTRTFGNVFQTIVGAISSIIPISLFEILVIGIVCYVIYFIVMSCIDGKKRKDRSTRRTLNLAIITLSLLVTYNITAGTSYYRESVDVPQYTNVLEDTTIYGDVCNYFLDDFNQCAKSLEFDENGMVKNPYNQFQFNNEMRKAYSKLDSDYFTKATVNPKPMYLLGWFYREVNITGVSFRPSGEANYNPYIPDVEKPITAAHEIAHSKGVMRENDANLVAAYVCLTSDSPYFRFSAYNTVLNSLSQLLRATNNPNEILRFYANIDSKIYACSSAEVKFWQDYTLLSDISNAVNNFYLKVMGNGSTTDYIDHTDGQTTTTPQGETKYVINSYSPYQALLMYLYFEN